MRDDGWAEGRTLLAPEGEYDLFGSSAHGLCRSVELQSVMTGTVSIW